MHRSLGIVKEIDNLGRIVIPKDVREALKLEKQVELVITEFGLLIRSPKYEIVMKTKEGENEDASLMKNK